MCPTGNQQAVYIKSNTCYLNLQNGWNAFISQVVQCRNIDVAVPNGSNAIITSGASNKDKASEAFDNLRNEYYAMLKVKDNDEFLNLIYDVVKTYLANHTVRVYK